MSVAFDGAMLLTAWLMGFLGSTHCVGMCGGISAALSFALPANARTGIRLFGYQLGYNIGRVGTYGLLGALIGLLGSGIISPWASGTIWPRLLAGLFMIALGLYIAGVWKGLQRLERFGGGIWKYVQPLTQRLLPVDNPLKALIAGGLWGFLPCGLVYSALGLALSRAHPAESAAIMVAFGLGTLPTLLVTGSLATQLRQFMQAPNTRRLAGLTVVVFGVLTLSIPFFHGSHQHHEMNGHDMSGMTPATPAAPHDMVAPAMPDMPSHHMHGSSAP